MLRIKLSDVSLDASGRAPKLGQLSHISVVAAVCDSMQLAPGAPLVSTNTHPSAVPALRKPLVLVLIQALSVYNGRWATSQSRVCNESH